MAAMAPNWYAARTILLLLLLCLAKRSTCQHRTTIESRKPTHAHCKLVSSSYEPSLLEKQWLRGAGVWADSFCSHMAKFEGATTEWLAAIKALKQQDRAVAGMDASVFSRMVKEYDCGGQRHVDVSWIEPLSHGLRHPNSLCKRGASLTDKDYLLLSFAGDAANSRGRCRNRRCQAIYMDLGASTWTTGAGGPSQSWFYEAYQQHGITFDRMLLWEARAMPPQEIFQPLPKELWHKYQYFNMPASPNLTDPSSPLRMLKTIAQPNDFVVLKVDIDSPHIENQIIEAILRDPELIALVDELFYEYHVNFGPMNKIWFETLQPAAYPKATLSDAYKLFYALRKTGIRVHSWI
jgi:hypothetical protein